jgi:hypothetical protein
LGVLQCRGDNGDRRLSINILPSVR